jgi:hypothetical protein
MFLERAEILQQTRSGGKELTQNMSQYEETVLRDDKCQYDYRPNCVRLQLDCSVKLVIIELLIFVTLAYCTLHRAIETVERELEEAEQKQRVADMQGHISSRRKKTQKKNKKKGEPTRSYAAALKHVCTNWIPNSLMWFDVGNTTDTDDDGC